MVRACDQSGLQSDCFGTRAANTWSSTGRFQLDKSRQRLKIMAIGGSITFGQGSSHGNGYRARLREKLVAHGYVVDMVGSRRNGSMDDNDHEGWRGFRIEQIMSKAQLSLPKHNAHVFLVNAGSNDCVQDFEISSAGDRVQSLLDFIWKTSPKSTILLSTLLVNEDPDINSRVRVFNQCIRQLVVDNAGQDRRILLVDMQAADGPQRHELMDGTHPNDAGYDKMASLWYQGILEAAAKNFLTARVNGTA